MSWGVELRKGRFFWGWKVYKTNLWGFSVDTVLSFLPRFNQRTAEKRARKIIMEHERHPRTNIQKTVGVDHG